MLIALLASTDPKLLSPARGRVRGAQAPPPAEFLEVKNQFYQKMPTDNAVGNENII